jgi:choline dehydrogenase-like flavoprotein
VLTVARRRRDDVLGNRGLERFDYCIVGSGAGGGTAAHVLTAAGKTVLVLEAGHNPFPGLDHPRRLPLPLHSNDELKYSVRDYIAQQALLEPRVFRTSAATPGALAGDVNLLPKAVGGAFQHADCAVPRFTALDFRMRSTIEALIGTHPTLAVPGFGADVASANWADWPFGYAELEPFYAEAESLYGVAGDGGANPFQSARSGPYPMAPGVPMYLGLKLAEGARRTTFDELDGGPLHPHVYPKAINSTFRDGRPPCVDCGLCSGFGCPNNAKGSPAVTVLRRALVSGRCQLRFNAAAVRLVRSGSRIGGVEYVDADGERRTATADAYLLAASAIESARLCLLSDPGGPGLGNGSGQVGRNLMFHLQTNVNGFAPERIHGQRGRAVTHGLSDFRGVEPGGEMPRVFSTDAGQRLFLGGICEFSAPQGQPITEDGFAALQLGIAPGTTLKHVLRDQALGQHLFGLVMQAEDAPQLGNFVDLDTRYRDVHGLPVARVTYASHEFELAARRFYVPILRRIVANAGAKSFGGVQAFLTPCNPALVGPPSSRHVLGTLRMGPDPASSVVDPGGRFHELENLYACDGSVFPTSSGWNPTLTIIAVALRIAHGLAATTPAAG